MFHISLINMPFAELQTPSLALTKLQSIVRERYKETVSVEIKYLNHDFGNFFGVDNYNKISFGSGIFNSGTGFAEWLFRQVAFPDQADNTEEYFLRYSASFSSYNSNEKQAFKRAVLEKRSGLDAFIDRLIYTHCLHQAQIVGLTTGFFQNTANFAIAQKIKKLNKDVIIVMGGPHCDSPMGDVILSNVSSIDYIFQGHSLISFPQFIDCCLSHNTDSAHEIQGVLSRHMSNDSNSDIAITTGCKNKEKQFDDNDINKVVELDYNSFFESLDSHFSKNDVIPQLLFETSRGCDWASKIGKQCTFCGLNANNTEYKIMSAENATKQFKSLFKYADRCNRYFSIDNSMPTSYINDIFKDFIPPDNTRIFYDVRPRLSVEELCVLRNAGIRNIEAGIESLSTDTLKRMKKGSTAFGNITFLMNCVEAGVNPHWFLLVGTPGEDATVYNKYISDLPKLFHLPPPQGPLQVVFNRYSAYVDNNDLYGLNLLPNDYYALTYPFSRSELADFAYFFADYSMGSYVIDLANHITTIFEMRKAWASQWYHHREDVPMLYFVEQDGFYIYDSRSGEAIIHKIDESVKVILDYLSKPRILNRMIDQLPQLTPLEIYNGISFLRNNGLLFEEHERAMNIVFQSKPQNLSGLRTVMWAD